MGRLFARRGERRDELLSAYMDGELSAEEQTRLETQLQTDPALQAELDALRHTVALVRNLAPVAIPRNFILSQTMLTAARPQPAKPPRLRRAWNVPFLTAATAVVSLMFVVILAGDLLLVGRMGGDAALLGEQRMAFEAPAEAPAPAAVEEAAVEQVAVEREVVVEAEVEELGVQVEETVASDDEQNAEQAPLDTSATAPASGGGGPTVEPATVTSIAAPSPSAELDVAPAASTTIESAAPISGPTVAPATATPIPSPTLRPTVVVEAEDVAAIPPMEPPSPGVGEEAPVYPPGVRAQDPPTWYLEDPRRASISPLRVIEIVLGLAALGLALATIWARRARRQ